MSTRRERLPDRNILDLLVQSGTRVMGAGAGTVSYPRLFSGSPNVMLTPLAGSSSFGRTIPLGVRSVFSGSFTFRGSPAHGTFNWSATGRRL